MNEYKQIDSRQNELLNGGIDGELNAEERGELDKLLASSESIRDINKELTDLTDLLDATPERDPPEYLQQAIVRSVRLPVADKQEEKPGIFAGWLPSNWLRTGVALAAGAVLTVGIYEMGSVPMTAEDSANLVGTIVQKPVPGQGILIDTVYINNDSLAGVVELRKNEDLYTLDVQLNSDGLTEVNVDLTGLGLEFEGITRMQDDRDNVSVINGSVNVASSGGQHYALKLRGTAAGSEQLATPLRVEFFANNTLVHQAELSRVEK
jgi:hypothetical protein